MRPNKNKPQPINQTLIPPDYEERVVEINRTSKKTKGGNQLSFSAVVVVGNRQGRVGVGVGKAKDVALAIQKAIKKGRNSLIDVVRTRNALTIPHEVRLKEKAVILLLKPAPPGTGVKAGGAMRPVLELAGIQNVVGKILRSSNKRGNVYGTIKALEKLHRPAERKVKPNKHPRV